MDKDGKIRFEYLDMPNGIRVVALDSKLVDFEPKPAMENGRLVLKTVEKTVKDCVKIDGCIYVAPGRVADVVMVDMIEKFQKLLKEDGWEPVEINI